MKNWIINVVAWKMRTLTCFSNVSDITWCWLCTPCCLIFLLLFEIGSSYLVLTVLLGRRQDVSDRGGGRREHGRRGDHSNLRHSKAVVHITWEWDVSMIKARENKIYIYIFSSRIHILWNIWHSPLCWVWPLGVTLSLGSIERGFTASVTGKNISQLLTWIFWLSQSEIKKSYKCEEKNGEG